MTAHRFVLRVATIVAAVGLVLAGCTGQAGTGAPASVASSVTRLATPSTLPGPPTAEVSATPSAEPTDGPIQSPVDTAMPEPPAAALAVDGGDPVVGELGSFSWDNSGSDSPWLPGARMHVGSGERLTLRLATDVPIERWTVTRTPGATFGSGPVGVADGSTRPVTFATPPRGTWSVQVEVWFAHNLGSAAYYWLIAVD